MSNKAKLKNAVRVFREHRKKLKVDKTSLHKFVRGKDKNLKEKKNKLLKGIQLIMLKFLGMKYMKDDQWEVTKVLGRR